MVRSNQGGTWQTLDDYQHAAGRHTDGRGLAVDASGRVYAGSWGYDAAGIAHWIVRSPAAGAATMSPAASFPSTQIDPSDASAGEELTLADELLV